MNTLFIYMVKAAVYLIAFYLVYSIMLSRDTSYGRNRIFILLSMALALTLPYFTLLTLKPLGIQFFGKFLSEVFVTATTSGKERIASGTNISDSLQVIYSIYTAGVIVFLFKLLTDFLNLMFLIVRQKNRGSRIIRFHGFNTAGFSAMGYIFINTRLSPEESGEIIRHEQNHLKQNHFLDIILIEIVKAFQWFNPVVYFFDRSLRAIHEYQADKECLNSGVPIVNYQSLLLNQVFKSKAFNLTNSFSNPSLIKKRMIMMTKKRTSAIASMKLLMVIPAVVVVFLAISAYKEIPNSPVRQITPSTVNKVDLSTVKSTLKVTRPTEPNSDYPPPPPPPPPPSESKTGKNNSQTANKDVVVEVKEDYSSNNTPFVVVEEMPMFPGGEIELLKYLAANTVYPEVAKQKNISGRVIVRFCVTSKGEVDQESVLRGVSPELDDEAIRVVKTLPTFFPGKQGGKAVPVWYMVPIIFTLQ